MRGLKSGRLTTSRSAAGRMKPIAEISGATSEPKEALIGARVTLVRDIKSRTIADQKCNSLAGWQARTRPYLEE